MKVLGFTPWCWRSNAETCRREYHAYIFYMLLMSK